MGLEIRFNTDDIKSHELNALAALIAVLGGRAPDNFAAKQEAAPAPVPAPPTSEIPLPPAAEAPTASEALMAAEAARAAVPPPPTADPATAAPPTSPPAGVEVDANGFPHDMRIHAATKSRKNDDTWTYKRGLSDDAGKALIRTVEAELRATMAIPTPPATNGPAQTDPAAAFPGSVPPPPAETPPAADAVPPPPADTPPVEDTAIAEFARIMRVVVAKQAAGTLPTQEVSKACAAIGIPDMKALRFRPDLIPAFEALLP